MCQNLAGSRNWGGGEEYALFIDTGTSVETERYRGYQRRRTAFYFCSEVWGRLSAVHKISFGKKEEVKLSLDEFVNSIKLEIESPLIDNIDENFVYTLTGKANKNSSNNTVIDVNETPIPVETSLIGKGIITPETLHEYKLTIKLKENNQNQNYLSGKIFIAKIVVEKDYE